MPDSSNLAVRLAGHQIQRAAPGRGRGRDPGRRNQAGVWNVTMDEIEASAETLGSSLLNG